MPNNFCYEFKQVFFQLYISLIMKLRKNINQYFLFSI
jgi:hypothetical protein